MNVSEALRHAATFTDAYRQGGDIAFRELRCLRTQFPAVFDPIGGTDLFVGYFTPPLAGYCYGWDQVSGWVGYYADLDRLKALSGDPSLDSAERALAAELHDFWSVERTQAQILHDNPAISQCDVLRLTEIFIRLAEINLDFDMLLQLGIPGLRRALTDMQQVEPRPILEAELGALDLMADCLRHFAREARDRCAEATPERRRELRRMAETLEYLTEHAPDGFYSALSLFHLAVMMTNVDNFARMDIYLGDFLTRDLDAGVLTREEALEILVNLYSRFGDLFPTTGRIIIGGEGRRNAANADRMALLLLDAARIVHKEGPTLCLRLHRGLDPAIWDKACDVLEAGCGYPLLFNDAVNIPGRMRALHVPREEAEQYIMSNCGEYGIWARSIHSPNAAIGYAKVLELTLHNGVDPATGEQQGLRTGRGEDFVDFESLLEAFQTQATHFIKRTVACMPAIYRGAAEQSHNLLMSMLHHDSFETGHGLLEGARYRILDVETHSIVHVADSLTAIKTVVFEEHRMTMEQLIAVLDANFADCPLERAWLKRAPKFGNCHADADAMVRLISDFVYAETAKQAACVGVHAVTASQITVDNYIPFGEAVGATPDGRLSGEPTTNSTNPSNGSDRAGVTALLTSMAGVDSSRSGGQVCHLKLTAAAFSAARRAATSAMIATFFAQGGGELSIYTVRQEDLEDAMAHPERHQDLIVRIGGYNARFVALSRPLQEEMIARNAYQ